MKNPQGRKPLSFADRVANAPLRLYPHEIETIKRRAVERGISAMAWKREAIRDKIALEESAAPEFVSDLANLRDNLQKHLDSDRVGRIVVTMDTERLLEICENVLRHFGKGSIK